MDERPQSLRAERTPRPTRLPGRRATIGGLLVAAAMVGSFALSNRAAEAPALAVVVASSQIAPGDELSAGDLQVEHVDLPPSVAERTFGSVAELVGAVALAPVGPGELVQSASVLTLGEGSQSPDPQGVGYEYSFAVDADRALGGALEPGEVVDVVATMGSGDGAYSSVVAHDAVVLAVSMGGGGLVAASTTLTLGLASAQEVLELAHAREEGAVSVVRATRAGRGHPAPPPYRPRTPGRSP